MKKLSIITPAKRQWRPFPGFDRTVEANKRRRRRVATRTAMPATKAEAREACEQAWNEWNAGGKNSS